MSVGNISATNLGNISALNLDGNASNVLYGNGAFASKPTASVPGVTFISANGTVSKNSIIQVTNSAPANIQLTLPAGSGLSTGDNIKFYPWDQSGGNFQVFTVKTTDGIQGLTASGGTYYITGNIPVQLNWAGSYWYYSEVTTSGGGGGSYGNSNVVTLLTSYGSNTITTTGNVSVGNIIGNGQSLTGLTGANVTGAVSYATTANSVAGANVSGTVANATYATSAGSATTAGTITTAAQPNITSTGTLTSLSVSGTITSGNISSNVANATTSTLVNGVGYLGIPQNSQGSDYTLTIADQGKHIYATATANIIIPSNSNVAYPVGTVMSLVTAGSGCNVQIQNDTLIIAGNGTSGNRTLSSYGMATIMKVANTTWYISGAGVS